MDDIESLLTLARTVAPELGERPLYIVKRQDLPYSHGDIFGVAFSARRFDFNHVKAIDSETWAGPSDVIGIDFRAIALAAKPGRYTECVQLILLHELAHILPLTTPPENIPAPSRALLDAQASASHQMWHNPPPAAGTVFDFHGLPFIRRALHLWCRATFAGYCITPAELFGGDLHWASPPEHYIPLILAEAFRMRCSSFYTIELTPPPAEFAALWQSDLQFHQSHNRQEDQTPCQQPQPPQPSHCPPPSTATNGGDKSASASQLTSVAKSAAEN